MTGVKGRSGGFRQGAGRKPKPKTETPVPATADSPLAFLKGVMNDLGQPATLRVRAAIAAAQYEHAKKGEGGKKEGQEQAAQTAADKFKTGKPPLRVVGA